MCVSQSLRSCPTLRDPKDCSPPSQAPLPMGFSRQEYWSGLMPPPGDLPDLGMEPRSPVSPALRADSLPLSPK